MGDCETSAGADADAGWEKVWRAACWAQLQNASQFYFELAVRLTSILVGMVCADISVS